MAWTFTPPEKEYGGYLFDCDGTLADSMPLHYQAWLQAVRIQIPDFEWPEPLFYSMAGLNVSESVKRLNDSFHISLDPIRIEADKLAIFQTIAHRIEPIPPIVQFARYLHSVGKPIAIGTGAHRVDAEQTLTAIGVRDLFKVIVAQEDVSHGKPNPETYLRAAELIGVSPAQCLVLEDGELGIQAAQAASMDVVRIPHNRSI